MTSHAIFENAALEYDAWFEKYRPVYDSEISALKRFLPPGGGGLEIGVGTGRFTGPLGIRVGVEPARAMADLARQRGIPVVRGVAEALPFRDGAFKLVAMVTVLCFLSDPLLALSEAARVLKPGGQLLIGMLDKDSPLGRQYEAHKLESAFFRLARFYSVSQVLAWLARLPFQGLQTCQTLVKNLQDITVPEPVAAGHGAGGFAVIAAQRT